MRTLMCLQNIKVQSAIVKTLSNKINAGSNVTLFCKRGTAPLLTNHKNQLVCLLLNFQT